MPRYNNAGKLEVPGFSQHLKMQDPETGGFKIKLRLPIQNQNLVSSILTYEITLLFLFSTCSKKLSRSLLIDALRTPPSPRQLIRHSLEPFTLCGKNASQEKSMERAHGSTGKKSSGTLRVSAAWTLVESCKDSSSGSRTDTLNRAIQPRARRRRRKSYRRLSMTSKARR